MSNINALCTEVMHEDLTFKPELHKKNKSVVLQSVAFIQKCRRKNELGRYRTF